jgi:hypothetical protein
MYAVGEVTLLHDHFAWLEADDLGGIGDQLELGRGQTGEQRDVSQCFDVSLQWLHGRVPFHAVALALTAS